MPTSLLEVLRTGERSFALLGELDLASARELDEVLPVARGAERLTIDLSRVSFVDVTGLVALRSVAEATRSRSVEVVGAPSLAHRIVAILGWRDGRLRFDRGTRRATDRRRRSA